MTAQQDLTGIGKSMQALENHITQTWELQPSATYKYQDEPEVGGKKGKKSTFLRGRKEKNRFNCQTWRMVNNRAYRLLPSTGIQKDVLLKNTKNMDETIYSPNPLINKILSAFNGDCPIEDLSMGLGRS